MHMRFEVAVQPRFQGRERPGNEVGRIARLALHYAEKVVGATRVRQMLHQKSHV